jgi:hypothetical protein
MFIREQTLVSLLKTAAVLSNANTKFLKAVYIHCEQNYSRPRRTNFLKSV